MTNIFKYLRHICNIFILQVELTLQLVEADLTLVKMLVFGAQR
jgi:hypothetical protein